MPAGCHRTGIAVSLACVALDFGACLSREADTPGEKTIGITESTIVERKTIPGGDSCNFCSIYATPTLQHFPYAFDLLKDGLFRAMERGEINPREVATIFVFSKNRICRYRPGRPAFATELIDDTPFRSVAFRAPFERTPTSLDAANRCRDVWFLPRLGRKHDAGSLAKAFGIDISIGNTID